jgi:prepilin-type processing-associated H-X9-DG protein
LKLLVCPSDPPANPNSGPNAYVANGLVLRDPTLTSPLAPQSLDYVSSNDGASNTLMLGENTQTPPPAALAASATAKLHYWWYDVNTSSDPSNLQVNQTFGYAIPATPSPPYSSNLSTFAAPYGNSSTPPTGYTNVMTANINSAHGGGAVVAFFDGHTTFLRDDVGLTPATGSSASPQVMVYQILVTPEGSKCGNEPPADESQWQ